MKSQGNKLILSKLLGEVNLKSHVKQKAKSLFVNNGRVMGVPLIPIISVRKIIIHNHFIVKSEQKESKREKKQRAIEKFFFFFF